MEEFRIEPARRFHLIVVPVERALTLPLPPPLRQPDEAMEQARRLW